MASSVASTLPLSPFPLPRPIPHGYQHVLPANALHRQFGKRCKVRLHIADYWAQRYSLITIPDCDFRIIKESWASINVYEVVVVFMNSSVIISLESPREGTS